MRNSPTVRCAARFLRLALTAASTLVAASALPQAPPALPASTPAAAGMSMERLDHMRDFFRGEVEKNVAAGYVILVARGGKLVYSATIGMRDRARQRPLMLYEEGRFHLDDPVSRFLPEFANERVFTGVDAQGALTTESANEPITIRHLLTQIGRASCR